MKYIITLGIFLALLNQGAAQVSYFPPLSDNSNWETTHPTVLGYNLKAIDTLYPFLESTNTKAFMILVDGKIVLEKYFGTFTVDSSWYWASAGKTLTSMLVGIAKQEGKLKLTDTSSKYLGQGWTSCSLADEQKITIRHELTMTTGLDDNVPDTYCTLPSCIQCLSVPGSRWAYHNAPYTKLDDVILSATGVNINTYLTQKIKPVTGMSGLYIKLGYNNIFFSKPRSMARFGLLMLNKGKWNTTGVLTDTNYFNEMITSSNSINPSYGYLCWLNGKSKYMLPQSQVVFNDMLFPEAPHDMFSALGKDGQILNVIPSKKLVMIRMGDAPDGYEVPVALNDSIWKYFNKVLISGPGINTLTIPGANTIAGIPNDTTSGVNTVPGLPTTTGVNTIPGTNDPTESILASVTESKFEVYPNPASNALTIKTEAEGEYKVELLNVLGKTVYEGILNKELAIRLENPGFMILKIKSGNGTKTFRILRY